MRTLSLTLAVLGLAGLASAQTTPPPAPPPAPPAAAASKPPAPLPAGATFAFINLQYVIAESKIGQAGLAELQKTQQARDEQLRLMAKEITSLQEKYTSQAATLSADARRTLEVEIDAKRRRLQFETDTRDADLQRMGRDMLDDFSAKVLPIVDGLRKERGLIAIFGLRAEPGGIEVLAGDPGLDLSSEIVKRLDGVKK
jgi:Skp family chaperone for outer membrane proteins